MSDEKPETPRPGDVDAQFPWNEAITIDAGSRERATIMCLAAVHEQLCVNAALLRRLLALEVRP